jgi:RHS repeat-associated protein
LTDPAGGIFGFGYDSLWRLTGVSRPNGVKDVLSYDAAGNLLSRTASLGATTVYNVAYTYDPNGRRASFADPSGTSAYTFNPAGEVTAASHPVGGPASEQFVYDAAGNRTSTASMAAGTLAYDNANRLTSDAHFAYSYDNEGDLTSKSDKATHATTTYAWNMRHQLTSMAFPDGTATSYRYDPLGRRIESNASGVVTRDVYDGQNLRLRYDGNNSLTASYVDAGLDGHLEETQAGQRLFYLQDGSNSTVQLTNANGAGVASYSYDTFGIPAASNGSSPANPFTYTGREFDAKSGLYYYRARYYAPDQGRFLSEDPVAHVNAYTYTQNDPVDFGDPSGAVLTEYAVLTASTQKFNVASCISAAVGAVASVAAAGATAAFDQPGAAASAALKTFVAGAAATVVTCALAAVPAGAAEEVGSAAKGLSPELRALSKAHITESGETVLGHFPGYVAKAEARGASYFDIGAAWNGLTGAERSAANEHFLDIIAARGDTVLLSTPKTQIQEGSQLANEVGYLTGQKGYKWVNQWALKPGE